MIITAKPKVVEKTVVREHRSNDDSSEEFEYVKYKPKKYELKIANPFKGSKKRKKRKKEKKQKEEKEDSKEKKEDKKEVKEEKKEEKKEKAVEKSQPRVVVENTAPPDEKKVSKAKRRSHKAESDKKEFTLTAPDEEDDRNSPRSPPNSENISRSVSNNSKRSSKSVAPPVGSDKKVLKSGGGSNAVASPSIVRARPLSNSDEDFSGNDDDLHQERELVVERDEVSTESEKSNEDEARVVEKLEAISVSDPHVTIVKSHNAEFSNIIFGDELWVWLKNEGMPTQYKQVIVSVMSTICPTEQVAELWNQGLVLKQIEYGEGRWVLTADNLLNSRYTSKKQSLNSSKEFPKKIIEETWTHEGRVVNISHCNGQWFVISEEESEYTVPQKVVVKTSLNGVPEELKRIWDRNDKVSTFAYGNGFWVIITEPRDKIRQKFYGNSRFPTKKIKEFYDEGRHLHTLAYGGKDRMWVMIVEMEKGINPRQLVNWSDKFPFKPKANQKS